MPHAFNRDMLQLARAARGFTQGELAERAGVTQALISKLENGLTLDPTQETVEALASALDYPVSFLFSDEKPHGLPPFHFRKRASLGAKALAKIEADINIRRIHLERLLKSFELPASKDFPIIDLERNRWSPRDAAQALRGHWMLPRGPIDSLTSVAERAGAVVVQIDFDTPRLDALSFRLPGMPPLIFMNSKMPGDRYRFSLAHEIAHLACHIRHHLHTLRYSVEEMATLLMLSSDEFADTYTERPRIRVVK
jgi:transcriptional regulator with XRE-family HTH domain